VCRERENAADGGAPTTPIRPDRRTIRYAGIRYLGHDYEGGELHFAALDVVRKCDAACSSASPQASATNMPSGASIPRRAPDDAELLHLRSAPR